MKTIKPVDLFNIVKLNYDVILDELYDKITKFNNLQVNEKIEKGLYTLM